jgi:NAD+ kinase
MHRLGFAFNPTRPHTIELRDRAVEWCRARNVAAWSAEAGNYDVVTRELADTDCLVVLGGDGTFLRAARALAAVDVPVLGVNSGRIGFLSKVDAESLEGALDDLVAGRFSLELRMMLNADMGGRSFAALNDAAIVRGAQVRLVQLEVQIDGSHLATWLADGVVVATPTGSTAYSFSAGGPILDPTSRNLVVTPIAAYLAAIRSIVVGPRHVVVVRVVDGGDCLLSIDGREDHALEVGASVEIRAIERPLRLVEPQGALPFWELLRRKAALLPS